MVLLSSHRIPRVLWYSGYTPLNLYFAYRDFTFFVPTFQLRSTIQIWCFWVSVTPINITITWFGLFPFRSPLLRKSIVFFLFLRVLRCFSSPGSLPYTMCSCMDTSTLLEVGSPIRKSADHKSFALPRSLSQLVTSFFGSWCQGIHLMLFFAWTSYSVLTFQNCLSFKTWVSYFRI